jgi:hypothetical protein
VRRSTRVTNTRTRNINTSITTIIANRLVPRSQPVPSATAIRRNTVRSATAATSVPSAARSTVRSTASTAKLVLS